MSPPLTTTASQRPATANAMTRKHLHRLDVIFNEQPVFFITTCTAKRRKVLDSERMHEICLEVWKNAEELYGWYVGRYVVMPDHVHFFCTPKSDQATLQLFVGKWKEWTAKYATRRHGIEMPLWQPEFFDHVLRSGESYEEKWTYTRDNPVRAELIEKADEWPFQGELNEFRIEDI